MGGQGWVVHDEQGWVEHGEPKCADTQCCTYTCHVVVLAFRIPGTKNIALQNDISFVLYGWRVKGVLLCSLDMRLPRGEETAG